MVADTPNWSVSAFSFIGFVLCMIPLPWHLEAWNTGTCLYMIWTGVACLNQFINSVVWNSDTINRAPVWCDISTHILIASALAIPAASLCINRRLYQIASVQSVTKTRAQKRRDIIIDLAIGVGFPILYVILNIVNEAHRFLIYEEVGCLPFIWNTPLAYPLYFIWPIITGLISASYCIRSIREFAIRRAQFKEFLSTNRNLSSSRYFRLMGLASLDLLCTLPLAIYFLCAGATSNEVQPYVSWDVAHEDYNTVLQIPSAIWRANPAMAIPTSLNRSLIIFCAFAFFGFFGFADEAMRNYRLAYLSVAKRVGLSTGSVSAESWTGNGTNPDMSCNSRSATLPITHQAEKKRDSLASFSSQLSLPDYGGALTDVKNAPFTSTATSSGSRESLPRSPMDMDAVPLPTFPEATLDVKEPPRYAPDAPSNV